MNAEEQLNKIASDVSSSVEKTREELNGRIDAITKGQADYSSQIDKLTDLVKEVQGNSEEVQKHSDKLDARLKELTKNGMATTKAAELTTSEAMAKSIVENPEYEAYKNDPSIHKGIRIPGMLTKAVGTMTFSASTTGDVAEQTRLPILPDVDRPNRVRNFIPQGTMIGDSVRYAKVTGGEGTAGNQTEGNAKSQVDKDMAEQTFNAQVIAAFARISTQMLDDISGMTSYLSYELTRLLMNQEDSQLLTGDGTGTNLYGLAANAADENDLSVSTEFAEPNKWDCIQAASGYLASQDYMPDCIMVNPADFYTMVGSKGSNGQYVAPFYFDAAQNTYTLFGMPVYHSSAVAEGSFFVFDKAAASQLFQRSAPSVQFFPQDSDNAQKNLVTVRVEERLAHVRKHDDAVFTATYANVLPFITPS
jgi:HK97 family phage major capsid protein